MNEKPLFARRLTKHLPDKSASIIDPLPTITDLIYDDAEPDATDRTTLMSCVQTYLETQNPVYAMLGFCIAQQMGVYPPVEILNFLQQSFAKYINAQGKSVRLDELMGLSVRQGQTPRFKEFFLRHRDGQLMRDMFRLTVLGATIEEAAHMTAARLKAADWNKTAWDIPDIVEETIRDRYLREWKEKLDSELLRRALQRWPADSVRTYLKMFPVHSIPQSLQHLV